MYTLCRLLAICVSPLEKNICSGSLSIFWLDYLFYCYWLYEFCICFEYQPLIWYIYFANIFPSLCREDLLQEEIATYSSILAWEIPWTEEPGRLWPIALQGVIHDWATEHGSTCGMQDLNSPTRTEHIPRPWKCQVLITELPGNSLDDLFLTRAVSLHTEQLAMSGDDVHL